MIDRLQKLFVLVADHSGQLAPLVAFAVVTVCTLPHAAAGRRRQTVAGILAGAAFVAMYAIFTAVETRDLRNLFDHPLRDVLMASMFGGFAVLEGVAAVALVVGRHGMMPIAETPAAPSPQD